ncbi:ABC transporter ATP-binding protein [Paraconexibacter antarcticus]|uniref:ABC transporter ATP-binding protein n=1 Tax=Paraconexibacter antarcticus TaxID=2949664 RepID=A0ABY5DVC0_9ACTN|nr:ABC transporter ATP-binding protein [Paraconexibacter antarcticus]UTI65248.1 ABC transporter ATP-binding protein [Paraconexibacter antarcticus]
MSDASEPPGELALDIRDLHVTFKAHGGDVHAVRGATLQVAPGEIVGLVGESGSGKSVLGLAALGLLPADPPPVASGQVLLDGVDMLTASEAERRTRRGVAIGAVFQDPMSSLNPSMRIGRQVGEAARTDDDAVIHQLLAHTGIPEPENKARAFPHELSGGLRQRVMIAMALARHPRLIVADEPTTALDVTVQARVLDLLAAAARERDVALLLVTHDLGVAARVCDRIAVAYAGRIVETGPAAEVLGAPRHPYTVGLLASRPRLDGTIAGGDLPTLPGRPPDPRTPPAGCAFAPRCPAADPVCATTTPVHLTDTHRDECHHPGVLGRWPEGGPHVSQPSRLLLVAPTPADAPAMIPAVPPEPALVVADVTKAFARPKKHLFASRPEPLMAVDGVSLTIPAGGSLALVGESGSGKSTLLRMVVGLHAPTSGTVTIGTGAPPQMIFQDAGASLTPWLPVGELIGERLAALGVPKDERKARVDAVLEAVGLPAEAASAVPRKLSGGQRQRAAIARAIAVPPALLACDEPVSALDVSLAAQVLNLLCHLRQTLGIALLFVTHDLAAARAVADDVAVMQRGKIVEHAPAEQLFTSPRHEYTQELLAAVPEIGAVA